MLTLQELFDDLSYGELSNVSMGNSSNLGTLKEADYPKVISAINMGLVEIYKRINLRQGTVVLHQHADVTEYYLRSEYAALVDELDEDFYLVQTDEVPFPDDVLKILSATDADGEVVHINDNEYPDDMFTPSFDTITLNVRSPVEVFTIKYQAKYPKIILTQNFNPATYKLHIPDFIEEPLLIYIAHRLFKKPVKIAKGEVNPSTTLMLEFENSMKKIENLNLDIDVNDTRDRFTANRWV